MQPKRIITTWTLGLIAGTLLVAVTSPWFVRSYLPDEMDPARSVSVPASGIYRWRSEGYATTRIGPHGMPGRLDVPENSDSIRIALWGDSQAEGVCVADDDKLFAQIERETDQEITVLPFARSGQDASDWLPQMKEVEENLSIDAHLILIVDLPDLDPTGSDDSHGPVETKTNSRIAASLPAFIIQGVRHLITDNRGDRRRLNFAVGPENSGCFMPPVSDCDMIQASKTDWRAKWLPKISSIRDSTKLPMLIVYAPLSPSISGGQVTWDDGHAEEFSHLSGIASEVGIEIVDTSDALRVSAKAGEWPHGFHNGQIGSGHLNAIGYQVIAREISQVRWQKRDER